MRKLSLGGHNLTYIPDGAVQLNPRRWLPESTEEDWRSRKDYLDGEGFLVASIGGLLVEHGERALLIDTGYGPHRVSAEYSHPALGILEGGRLPVNLGSAGRIPAMVDMIAFSHLHDDHVGWAFMHNDEGESMLFENASFATSAAEWNSWLPFQGELATDLGERIKAVGDGDEIFPGVTAWVTSGHTAGHTSYVISSGGEKLIVFGDVMHSPTQVERPDWRVAVDEAPDAAVDTRLQILRALSQPQTFGFGGHFADVVFGSVASSGSSYAWHPLH